MATRIRDCKKTNAGRSCGYVGFTAEVQGALGLARQGLSQPFQDCLGYPGHKVSYARPVYLSVLPMPCLSPPHPSPHLLPLLSLILSIHLPFACLSCSLFSLPIFPVPSYPSIHLSHPPLSPQPVHQSLSPIPPPAFLGFLHSEPPLSSTFLLTPWSASLLARERLGVMWPRREPTGLGSWLWSAAPEGVMSLRAITSPTSLGLLWAKRGYGNAVSWRPHTPSWSPRLCSPTSVHPGVQELCKQPLLSPPTQEPASNLRLTPDRSAARGRHSPRPHW